MLNLIKSLVIGNLLFINLSCNINKQHLSPRPFFTMTKSSYYDRSLDSMEIIGHFGLDSISTKINNTNYWEFRNSKNGFFNLHGMLRIQSDTVFILAKYIEKNKIQYCKEQVLFIFNNSAHNKIWAVDYSCNGPYVGGDSVSLSRIYFDQALNDTLYVFNLKSFLKSTHNNKDQKLFLNRTIITVSKSIGFIQFNFVSMYNRIRLNIYPNFSRLDSNSLMPNYQQGY